MRKVDGIGHDAGARDLGTGSRPHEIARFVQTGLHEVAKVLGNRARAGVVAQQRLSIAVLHLLHKSELAIDIGGVRGLHGQVDRPGASDISALHRHHEGVVRIGVAGRRSRHTQTAPINRARAIPAGFHLVLETVLPRGNTEVPLDGKLDIARHGRRVDSLLRAEILELHFAKRGIETILNRRISGNRLDDDFERLVDCRRLLSVCGAGETKRRRQLGLDILGLLARKLALGVNHAAVARLPAELHPVGQNRIEVQILARLDRIRIVMCLAALKNQEVRSLELMPGKLLEAFAHARHIPTDGDISRPCRRGTARSDLENDLDTRRASGLVDLCQILEIIGDVSVALALGGTHRRIALTGLS